MKVVLLARESPAEILEGLVRAGIEVDEVRLPTAESDIATLAACLEAAATALAAPVPAAAVVAGEGDAPLAAALAAVKLGVPTAWIGGTGPLPGLLADEALDASADSASLVRAVEALVNPKLGNP